MASMFDGLASTLTYYTGYDFTGASSTPTPSTQSAAHLRPSSSSSSSSSSSAPRRTPDFSSLSADPSSLLSDGDEEENATSLYAAPLSDDDFFNLGGSSFPLLPHAPYMVDPFDEDEDDEGGEQKRSLALSTASAARSSHHFSSVLNNPASSFYDFEEEDMLPFSPAYIPALSDAAIDAQKVRGYVERVGEMDVFAENHPGALQSSLAIGGSPRTSLSSSSSTAPLQSPASSHMSPFSSLPSAFTFSRRRTHSRSQSSSSRAHRRTSSHPTAEQLALKAAQEEEALAQRELLDCLATVPAPFFSPEFDLMQQPFFVTHLTSISFPASSAAAMANHTRDSIALQSTLSSQLDVVELNLFRQINLRSHLFFRQMAEVERLKAEVGEALEVIDGVREAVHYVDQHLVQAGLHVNHRHVHRRNVAAVVLRLEAMAMCTKTQQTVQLLLSTGDYSSSLMLIQQTRAVLGAELNGVASMRNVERKLVEQVRLIEKLMEQDAMALLTQADDEAEDREEDRRGSSLQSKKGLEDRAERRRGEAVQVIRRELTEDEKERLVPILESLVKLHTLPGLLSSYKKALIACVQQRLTALVYMHIDAVVNEDLEDPAQQPPTQPVPSSSAAFTNPTAAVAVSATAAAPSQSAAESSAVASGSSSSPSAASASTALPDTAVSAAAASTAVLSAVTAVGAGSPSLPPSGASQSPSTATDGGRSRGSPSPMPDLPPPQPLPSSALPVADAAPSDGAVGSPTGAVLSTVVVAVPVSASNPSTQSSAPVVLAVAAAASSITTRLQSLSHRQFIDFLSPLFSALMDPIYRAAAVRALLSSTVEAIERELDVTVGLSSPSASTAADTRLLSSLAAKKAEYQSNVASFTELLSSSSEYLYLRMAKLLHTRQQLHSVLPLQDFRELLDVVLSFLQQSESMCGRQFYGMRGALLSQAKAFVGHFHSQCMKEMAEGLEKEKWTRVDVDVEFQELIDSGFVHKEDDRRKDSAPGTRRREERKEGDGEGGEGSHGSAEANGKRGGGDEEKREDRPKSASTPVASTTRKVLFVPVPKSSLSAATPTSASPSPAASSASAFSFASPAAASSSSNFQKFPVVRSVLVALRLISHYVELSSHLPALTLDTLHRLLELLTLFNSRTCQLVLGAGAMHLAGLKSITATHLALSSQSIALLASQIPRLEAVFAARLQPKHRLFLQGFERVRKDCDEHCEQIREKLTNIMRDLIEHSTKRMQQHVQQQLQPTASDPSQPRGDGDEDEDDDVVSPSIRLLMKQTCSLHRALTDLLSVRERNGIFLDIGGALVGGFMVVCRKMEGEAREGGGAAAERLSVLLQANGLHVLMRMRTLTGVDEEVVVQLKTFVERLRGEQPNAPPHR